MAGASVCRGNCTAFTFADDVVDSSCPGCDGFPGTGSNAHAPSLDLFCWAHTWAARPSHPSAGVVASARTNAVPRHVHTHPPDLCTSPQPWHRPYRSKQSWELIFSSPSFRLLLETHGSSCPEVGSGGHEASPHSRFQALQEQHQTGQWLLNAVWQEMGKAAGWCKVQLTVEICAEPALGAFREYVFPNYRSLF